VVRVQVQVGLGRGSSASGSTPVWPLGPMRSWACCSRLSSPWTLGGPPGWWAFSCWRGLGPSTGVFASRVVCAKALFHAV